MIQAGEYKNSRGTGDTCWAKTLKKGFVTFHTPTCLVWDTTPLWYFLSMAYVITPYAVQIWIATDMNCVQMQTQSSAGYDTLLFQSIFLWNPNDREGKTLSPGPLFPYNLWRQGRLWWLKRPVFKQTTCAGKNPPCWSVTEQITGGASKKKMSKWGNNTVS